MAADEYGRCFVHSVPADSYGGDGRTDLYMVEPVPAGDAQVAATNGEGGASMRGIFIAESHDWFAQRIFLACNVSDGRSPSGPVLVQTGPWARGHKPDDETLALAFHFKAEEVVRYSTLDIAGGDPKNASCSVSHYTVIEKVEGFDYGYGDKPTVLRLTTVMGAV